jgi:hypothetical protein
MKLKLSDAPPVRWGGRAGRYAEFPGAVGRAYDPYSLGPLSFAEDYEVCAWHQVRFAQDTRTITGKPTKVRATVARELLEARITFTTVSRSGESRYHVACETEPNAKQILILETIAERSHARVVIHRRAELLSDRRLNWRLSRLRQASVVHLRDGPGVDPLILAAVRDGACSRTDLRQALPDLLGQLIDGRVAHLHCAGILVLDATQEEYAVQLWRTRHG